MYVHTKIEVSQSRLSKARAQTEQTQTRVPHRHTDKRHRTHHHAAFVGGNKRTENLAEDLASEGAHPHAVCCINFATAAGSVASLLLSECHVMYLPPFCEGV